MGLKRNQIMITALAVMIAVAGYLNFAGNKLKEETLVVNDEMLMEEDRTALLDLSEEDIASDIESMDQEAQLTENYLDEGMQESGQLSRVEVDLTANGEEAMDEVVAAAGDNVNGGEQSADSKTIEGTPGEAVFTSTQAVSTLSAAKLLKEQTRAKNKEALTEIVNNQELDASQKQEAVAGMVAMTDLSEREMEAEILLSAKGFPESVVSISNDGVDVVVCAAALTDAQLAQIMDIVSRKTEVSAEKIIISQVSGK
ncbi:MAG: SpoIIIAH-like family protein [Lachnospiraceae bacterium]|nr:SpoIIIAH-like family protein [Lachnospiraceae bacterium]MCI7596541.1 SpoIIIAH-like family protein [Lachnospiraceae bacterium]MDD7051364.1 SpoIIIAH-like family protein [Lachnospiraceae bacterium]MDY3221687.1 SpoIIIAH-like family protein [Lachnospiraceae bacterium]MDY4096514.1 SpoIIIAH-like family protein [Lachnospiraceae bacterium]